MTPSVGEFGGRCYPISAAMGSLYSSEAAAVLKMFAVLRASLGTTYGTLSVRCGSQC